MIKKMMALLAAISCAIGAWADVNVHLSGTDFSGLDAGSFVTGRDDSGEETESTYWFVGDTADFEGTIVTNSLGKKFLDFESSITNPLYRTISGCYGKSSPSQFETTPIGTGLFIDTTVQFTPYLVNENHPAPTAVTAEDKLIVWVRETEVEDGANVTNLIVTAGYYDVGNYVTPSNYVVNFTSEYVSELCNHTNRLTIKSFECVTKTAGGPAGFVVYLNETPVEYVGDAFAGTFASDLAATPALYYADSGKAEVGHRKLFPSLLPGNIANASKLSGVGYAGMGKISDVFFENYNTKYPEFAADPLYFDVDMGDGVVSYVYDNQVYTSNKTFPVAPTVAEVVISNVQYATGWKHRSRTWYNGTTIIANQTDANGGYGTFVLANGLSLHIAGFQANYLVGETEYQTLFGIQTQVGGATIEDGAISAALNGGGALKLTKDTTISEPGSGTINITNGKSLVIDLNGYVLRGGSDKADIYTINNLGGNLTVIDSSNAKTGAILGSIYYDTETGGYQSNNKAINLGEFAGMTVISAGKIETIAINDAMEGSLILNGGVFLDENNMMKEDFYLKAYIAEGSEIVSWVEDPDSDFYYATVSSATPVTTYDVTFSTNNIVVAEHNTTVAAGETLPVGAIPAFTGGAWDVDPTNAVINAATNFNYTIPPADPWAPGSKTDEAASNKVVEVFGEAVAEKIHTYDAYTNMVSYLAGKGVTDPDALKPGGAYAAAAPYVYQSYILGADELFTAEPKVTVTAVAANATTAGTGKWDFTVKVTEGESTVAYNVAADKVAALVKIRTSLTTGTWGAPTADNIEAAKPDGGNLIKVTINFGDGTSGFMQVAE